MNKIKLPLSNKISNKIFSSILLIILFIFIIQWIGFSYILNDAQLMYTNYTLKNNFTHFIDDIKSKNYDSEYIDLASQNYFNKNSNTIIIFDEDYYVLNESIFENNFSSFVLSSNGKLYNVLIDLNTFPNMIKSDEYLALYKISKSYYVLIEKTTDSPKNNFDMPIDPRITYITNMFIENMHINDNSFSLIFSYSDLLESRFNKDSNEQYQVFKNEYSDLNTNIIYYASKQIFNNSTHFIITSDLITSIDNQLNYINKMNFYISLLGVILAIIISKFFSNTISKPLIKLSASAKEMSNLNFSTKITLKRNDELGSLSKSLNNLSTQLESNLDKLKIQNQKLQINNTLLIKEEKRAKDLIHHLSHELNTPLGIISGFNEILTDGINDKEPKYYYDSINLELERMKTLINDMLELSILESGQLKLDLKPIKIDQLINECINNYIDKLSTRNIKLHFNLYTGPLLGDRKKIYQVINNFISNAAKYTTANGVFEIFYLDKKNYISIIFRNSTDIQEDNLDKLWEKFYRTDKENSRKSEGSGIGLSIVKEILFLHNSNFGIDVKDNKIEFYFSLKKYK